MSAATRDEPHRTAIYATALTAFFAIAGIAVLAGVGQPQSAVAVVEGGEHRQDRHAPQAVKTDVAAQDDDEGGGHQRLHQQDGAGGGQNGTAGAGVDVRAGCEDQQRDQRQCAVLEEGGREAADGERIGGKGADQGTQDQRHQHQSTGDFLHRAKKGRAGSFGRHCRVSRTVFLVADVRVRVCQTVEKTVVYTCTYSMYVQVFPPRSGRSVPRTIRP